MKCIHFMDIVLNLILNSNTSGERFLFQFQLLLCVSETMYGKTIYTMRFLKEQKKNIFCSK